MQQAVLNALKNDVMSFGPSGPRIEGGEGNETDGARDPICRARSLCRC